MEKPNLMWKILFLLINADLFIFILKTYFVVVVRFQSVDGDTKLCKFWIT